MDPEEAPIAAGAAAAQSNKTEAASPPARSRSKRSHLKRNICIGILASIIAVVLVIVILALTVFKAKDPKMALNSISVRDLSVELDMAQVRVKFNVSLDVNMAIKNPNKVSIKLKKGGHADIIYRGATVGAVPLPATKIPSDKTTAMNVTVTMLTDRFISNSQLFNDVVGGSLPMSTKAKVPAKVSVLGIKISVSATSTCDFTVFIGNRTVSDQDCKTKAKF